MTVLDASAAIEWLIGSSRAREVDRGLNGIEVVHVPQMFDVEVLNVLRRLERNAKAPTERIQSALQGLTDLRAVRWRHERLRQGIWRRRHTMSAYDAAYVELAWQLETPLLTCDAKLAAACAGDIEVVFAD